MYRRSGKSYIVSVIAAIYIIQGENVIVGSPTLSQSSRILFKEISEITDTLFTLIGGCKKIRDSLTYTTWSNGASLLALTAGLVSKQQEGYGGAFLLIDEGHQIDKEVLPRFLPSIDDAVEAGIGKVVVLGVGGHRSRLIEWVKEQQGWSSYKYKASMETNPAKQVIFDKAKATYPDWQWRQHYQCEQSSEGQRFMHSAIPEAIDISQCISSGQKPIIYFGIDVAKEKDSTIVKALSAVNKIVDNEMKRVVNEVDSFEINGVDY
jgi:hypothetical protein